MKNYAGGLCVNTNALSRRPGAETILSPWKIKWSLALRGPSQRAVGLEDEWQEVTQSTTPQWITLTLKNLVLCVWAPPSHVFPKPAILTSKVYTSEC